MNTTTDTETTITHELDGTDVFELIRTMKLVPPGWEHYSVQIVGKDVSKGCKIILKKTQSTKGYPDK